jgi:hypothetical protein
MLAKPVSECSERRAWPGKVLKLGVTISIIYVFENEDSKKQLVLFTGHNCYGRAGRSVLSKSGSGLRINPGKTAGRNETLFFKPQD